MNELLKPLELEHKHLVAEQPVLDEIGDAISTQADKIDELEKAAADILSDLKKLELG